jgi:hypothetical protein
MGRRKWYDSLKDMQSDLDEYLAKYNAKHPHQDRNLNGKIPEKDFKERMTQQKKQEQKKIKKRLQ